MYWFIRPPPSAKKTSSEAKNAKEAKRKGNSQPSTDPDEEDQKGVMYYEYDLMFHYLLASFCRADGENCFTSTGAKTFYTAGRSAPSPNAGSLPLLLMIIKLVCVFRLLTGLTSGGPTRIRCTGGLSALLQV